MKPGATFNFLYLLVFVSIALCSFWHGAVFTYMQNERIIEARMEEHLKILTSLPLSALVQIRVGTGI